MDQNVGRNMNHAALLSRYADLATAHVADACLQLKLPLRCAPAGMRPLWSGAHIIGRVCPVRHHGSAGVILQAIGRSAPGDVLVVDNGGRLDEACVGDLMALEASRAGLSGIVIWGLNRDSADLREIRLPVFSLGALPMRPQRAATDESDPFTSANCGDHTLSASDFVVGDDDGVIFVALEHAEEVAQAAVGIRDAERQKAVQMRGGKSLLSQTAR